MDNPGLGSPAGIGSPAGSVQDVKEHSGSYQSSDSEFYWYLVDIGKHFIFSQNTV